MEDVEERNHKGRFTQTAETKAHLYIVEFSFNDRNLTNEIYKRFEKRTQLHRGRGLALALALACADVSGWRLENPSPSESALHSALVHTEFAAAKARPNALRGPSPPGLSWPTHVRGGRSSWAWRSSGHGPRSSGHLYIVESFSFNNRNLTNEI